MMMSADFSGSSLIKYNDAEMEIKVQDMGVEIEKKFLVSRLPEDTESYPFHVIEQGYLNVYPAIRVRREDDIYYMTYKGDAVPDKNNERGIGKLEYNMSLDKASYEHMVEKADGNIIRKKRYLIPLNPDAFSEGYLEKRPDIKKAVSEGDIRIELDVFDAPFEGTVIAEIEFPDEDSARNYKSAGWFDKEVTGDHRYSNAHMSRQS